MRGKGQRKRLKKTAGTPRGERRTKALKLKSERREQTTSKRSAKKAKQMPKKQARQGRGLTQQRSAPLSR